MVRVRDVTLRDGLQGLSVVLPTVTKVEVYQQLLGAGVEEAQVTSFVSPRRLPQLADTEALWDALRPFLGVKGALIANHTNANVASQRRRCVGITGAGTSP